MKFNKILTDWDRDILNPVIQSMWNICPDMMGRKIPGANVQQAFVLNQIRLLLNQKEDSKIISIGCFEDTAYETLKRQGIRVVGVDPELSYDLHTYVVINEQKLPTYDIAFATSVLEHVKNDVQFLEDMCLLLNPGGVGILTMDFKDDYKLGDPLPATDLRFYTRQDLEVGFTYIIEKMGCKLVDKPDWTGKDNFIYQGHQYSFATFVFRKA
jgi:hypothetical protein